MDSLQPSGDVVEDVFLKDGLGSTIAEHAIRCQSLFNDYMNRTDIVPDPTIIDDQLARLSLWVSNMDVYGPSNVSLDYRLRFSPTAVDIIHQLLDLVCDTLWSLKSIDQRTPQTSRKRQRLSIHGDPDARRATNDYSSDSESDIDPIEGNVLKINETIGGTITRLFRLSNAVRKSAKANRARKIEMYTDDEEANKAIEELRLYTKCYIEYRFPEAPEALRTALVEANALRLRRLYYQHSHRRRIDLYIQNPKLTPAPVIVHKITHDTPTVQFAPNPPPLPKPATIGKMPPPVTNATTARETAVASCYAKSETVVPRAKSALVNNELSFPPIPPTQQCPYCGAIIESTNIIKSSLWQNHVIGDLEPFICIFTECLETCHHGSNISTSPLTFETSKAWSSHMHTAHGRKWECRAPPHDPIVFEQEVEYKQHSIKEHGVPEAYAAALSNAAQRPAFDKVLECPFGDDFQPPEEAGSSNVFLTEALESHVAGHMKEIALLALQKLPNDGDEDVNIDSDQLLEDDNTTRTHGVPRSSMCSILGDELLGSPQDYDVDAAEGNGEYRHEGISEDVTQPHPENKDNQGLSELHRAVQNEDSDLINVLTQSGMNVDSKDQNGQTPLHYAVERGFISCMEALLERGANPHTTDNSGFSPILWAVVAGQEDATQQMLFENSRVTKTDADMASALTWATQMGSDTITRMIIEHVGIAPGAYLREAAASGHRNIVELLLDKGCDPNYRKLNDWSAIHYAAEEGHLDVVRILLERHANPVAVSSKGTSPLHCAANGGHASIVSLILKKVGLVDTRRLTCHGWTTLHHAAYIGQPDVVRLLLKYDPDIALKQDKDGWSALHLAILRRDLVTIRILLNALPRKLFEEHGLPAEAWLYLSRTAKRDLAFDKSRCCRAVTGLRQAVTLGSVPLIKLLLNLGHDINGTDSGNRTALYYAAKNCMLPMIDLLISRGADPNILPVGRIEWEEFVRDPSVLLRLAAAGYKRPEDDDEVDSLIRQEFHLRKQRSGSNFARARSSGANFWKRLTGK